MKNHGFLCGTRAGRRRGRAGWRLYFTALSVGILCSSLTACGTLSTLTIGPAAAVAPVYSRHVDLKVEVDALVQPLIDKGVTPGAVVGVLLPDGSTRFFGYGVAEKGRPDRPDADTQFAVGSLSKGFLGAITDSLVQDGELSWDDTLAQLLPPNTPLSPDARKITLLQLATHTSGFPRQPFTFETLTSLVGYLFTGRSFYDQFDRKFLQQYLATFDAYGQVGRQYSNIGYGVLADVLEQRTGMTVDALLAQKIVGPLGLTRTGYNPELLPGYDTRAHGYAGDQPKFIRCGQPVPD